MESQLYLFSKFWAGSTVCQEKRRSILFLPPSPHPVPIPRAVNTVVQLRLGLYGFICVTMLSEYPSSKMERKHIKLNVVTQLSPGLGAACIFSIISAVSLTDKFDLAICETLIIIKSKRKGKSKTKSFIVQILHT